jgi:hypothetical protein
MNLLKGVLLYLLIFSNNLFGQNFFASAHGGANFAQIDGDNSAGFNKIKPSFGFRIDYPIKATSDVSFELNYSGRGAKGKYNPLNIDLNYIEIPLMFSFRDWYLENEKYDKVRLDVGASYGYLFSLSTGSTPISDLAENSNKGDLMLLGGVAYMFTSHVGISVRYSRSVIPILKDDRLEAGRFLSYFTTARIEYHF